MPELTSIEAILAHPAKYDGQLVHLKGAAIVQFEASFVCDTPEMISAGHPEKCLWLGGLVSDKRVMDVTQFNKKLVEVVGTFHEQFRGHLGAYGGTLSPVWSEVIGVHNGGALLPPPPKP